MVDLQPGGHMPHALEQYWLHGKGAAKIRWGMPSDWYRCVRFLRKYPGIRDPKGACTNLHKRALGVYPGQEGHLSYENEMAISLLAAAPLGDLRWLAPLAPIDVPTGDGRRFLPGALSFRKFPLPLEWVKTRTTGHQGAVTVGRILGATIGPDANGQQYAWGFGDFFNPADVPEVSQPLALIRGGVVGLSLDPGGLVQMDLAAGGDERLFTKYHAGGATLVSIPAFEGQYVLLGGPDGNFDGEDLTDEYVAMADHMDSSVPVQDGEGLPLLASDCGCGELAVNSSGWQGLPIAPRDASVDKDDAARRIGAWANGDAAKLNRAFLWRHDGGDPNSVLSYRLPVGDIIDGKLTMIYHAIYAASALLEGAHGGLPNIPDAQKSQLRRVISAIYKKMSTAFDDPTVKASWDRAVKRDNGVTPVEKATGNAGDHALEDAMPLTEISAEILVEEESVDQELAVNSSWSLPIADTDVGWDEGATRRALDSWAGDDLTKYGRAFLWTGATKSEMKFPIATIIDGKLTIVPRAVQAALGRLNSADIPDDAKARMGSILAGIRNRYTNDQPDSQASLQAAGGPVAPPTQWFNPVTVEGTGSLSITPEGQVYGYLATWKQCHMSVGRGRCVRAPRTQTDYGYFHLGSVQTAEGDTVKVGRLTVGGGHADVSMGVIPATEHYDNAGTAVAVVRAHEDARGILVTGAIVPGATDEQVSALRRSPLSGDWRRVNGNLELVAALAVNTPGFPVFAEDTEGHELSLISSGQGFEDHSEHVDFSSDGEESGVDAEEIVAKVVTVLDERAARTRRSNTLAAQKAFQEDLDRSRRAEILKSIKGAK